MAKKEAIHPWQQIEEQAFHAYREWPLWLVLRERKLAQQTHRPSENPAPAEGAQKRSANKRHDS